MIDFNNAILRLERYCDTINKAVVGTAIVEAVFVLIIGVLSNNLSNRLAVCFLIFVSVIYLLLLFVKMLYNKNYPGSITNELRSERELSVLKKDAERQRTINSFLVISMARLNGQTCALNDGDETHLCDRGITDGIHNLIEPVIDNIYFILDTINTKFTVGLYFQSYSSVTEVPNDSGIIIIRDGLSKDPSLPKNLMEISDSSSLFRQPSDMHLMTANM